MSWQVNWHAWHWPWYQWGWDGQYAIKYHYAGIGPLQLHWYTW